MDGNDNDVLVSKAAIALVLLGALLVIIGAGMIWGLRGFCCSLAPRCSHSG